ncbi:MAG: hypothetical protein AAGC92_05005 [Pseudomonadota bacterium]
MRMIRLGLGLAIAAVAIALVVTRPAPMPAIPGQQGYALHKVEGPRTLRVLWLGNSHTYLWDVPGIVARMYAGTATRGLEIHSLTKGGAALPEILALPETARRFAAGGWDVLILQEGSYVANIRHDLQRPNLASALRAIDTPDARVLLYQNWAYADRLMPERLRRYAEATGNPTAFTRLYEAYYADPPHARQAALDARFSALARQIGADVAYAGQAIWKGQRAGHRLISTDGNHLQADGAVVAAITIYRALFGAPPASPPEPGSWSEAGIGRVAPWSALLALTEPDAVPRGPGWHRPPSR